MFFSVVSQLRFSGSHSHLGGFQRKAAQSNFYLHNRILIIIGSNGHFVNHLVTRFSACQLGSQFSVFINTPIQHNDLRAIGSILMLGGITQRPCICRHTLCKVLNFQIFGIDSNHSLYALQCCRHLCFADGHICFYRSGRLGQRILSCIRSRQSQRRNRYLVIHRCLTVSQLTVESIHRNGHVIASANPLQNNRCDFHTLVPVICFVFRRNRFHGQGCGLHFKAIFRALVIVVFAAALCRLHNNPTDTADRHFSVCIHSRNAVAFLYRPCNRSTFNAAGMTQLEGRIAIGDSSGLAADCQRCRSSLFDLKMLGQILKLIAAAFVCLHDDRCSTCFDIVFIGNRVGIRRNLRFPVLYNDRCFDFAAGVYIATFGNIHLQGQLRIGLRHNFHADSHRLCGLGQAVVMGILTRQLQGRQGNRIICTDRIIRQSAVQPFYNNSNLIISANTVQSHRGNLYGILAVKHLIFCGNRSHRQHSRLNLKGLLQSIKLISSVIHSGDAYGCSSRRIIVFVSQAVFFRGNDGFSCFQNHLRLDFIAAIHIAVFQIGQLQRNFFRSQLDGRRRNQPLSVFFIKFRFAVFKPCFIYNRICVVSGNVCKHAGAFTIHRIYLVAQIAHYFNDCVFQMNRRSFSFHDGKDYGFLFFFALTFGHNIAVQQQLSVFQADTIAFAAILPADYRQLYRLFFCAFRNDRVCTCFIDNVHMIQNQFTIGKHNLPFMFADQGSVCDGNLLLTAYEQIHSTQAEAFAFQLTQIQILQQLYRSGVFFFRCRNGIIQCFI